MLPIDNTNTKSDHHRYAEDCSATLLSASRIDYPTPVYLHNRDSAVTAGLRCYIYITPAGDHLFHYAQRLADCVRRFLNVARGVLGAFCRG